MYNKPHKNLAKAKADFKLEAIELFTAFELDEEVSNQLYLDKIVEIKGIIKSIEQDNELTTIILDIGSEIKSVRCGMEPNAYSNIKKPLNETDSITLRGFCSGFSSIDIFSDVVLERCVVVEI